MTAPAATEIRSPHQPETFDLELDRLYAETLPDRMLPGHHGWVVATAEAAAAAEGVVDLAAGRELDRSALTVLDAPLWSHQGIALARYFPGGPAETSSSARPAAFRLALVREELRALAAATRWCQDFLASRRTGGQRLSGHPAVRLAMARATADVWALQAVDLPSTIDTPGGRAWLVDEIDSAANQLIKLAGGRAMLRGHAVQLQSLLLLLNRTYLEG